MIKKINDDKDIKKWKVAYYQLQQIQAANEVHISDRNAVIHDLKQKLKDMQHKHEEEIQRIESDANAKCDQCECEKLQLSEECERKIRESSLKLEAKATEIENLQLKKHQLRQSLHELEDEIAGYKQQLDGYKTEIKDMREKLQDMRHKYEDEIQQIERDANDKYEQCECEKAQLMQKIEQYERKMTRMRSEFDGIDKKRDEQMNELRQSLVELKKINKTYKEQIDGYEQEMDDMKQEHGIYQDKIAIYNGTSESYHTLNLQDRKSVV